jgi:RNA polymerase sigma-70 factor (ECF subfamily)
VTPPSDRPRAGGEDGSSPGSKDTGVDAASRGSGLTEADLERVRARDPEALAAFFEAYFDRVYGIVYRLLGERAAAEDVTQEVFLKVHRAAQHLDPTRDPRPWLTTIAYNACRDLWRSSAYRLSRRSGSIDSDPAVAARLTRGTNDPERHVLESERTRLVRQAIDRLPEPLRATVLLYDYQGMSHQEIASLMGINHAAARKRYSRALATLGKMLRGSLG